VGVLKQSENNWKQLLQPKAPKKEKGRKKKFKKFKKFQIDLR
jgi:hypothetical protein